MRIWLAERAGQTEEPVFPTGAGKLLSRDALEHRLAEYVEIAAHTCPSLGQKTVTMHVLRHTAAMRLLRAGIDTSLIALWLGHEQIETTQIYLHADLELKERALAKAHPDRNGEGAEYFLQIAALNAAKCDVIREEKASGTNGRPELATVLDFFQGRHAGCYPG
jgi:hypothetical protein